MKRTRVQANAKLHSPVDSRESGNPRASHGLVLRFGGSPALGTTATGGAILRIRVLGNLARSSCEDVAETCPDNRCAHSVAQDQEPQARQLDPVASCAAVGRVGNQ